jgi:hypothetical protein
MAGPDLILDGRHAPSFEEINDYIDRPGRVLWREIGTHLRQHYRASPRITYSGCSGKPGWNVKYQQSGKSLCTLYPEKDGFVALVVITLDRVPLIEGIQDELEPEVFDIMRAARPFNKTLWLMIPVYRAAILNSVKQLIALKMEK